jgi:phage-related protein
VADVEGNVEINVSGEGELDEAASAARNLDDALKDVDAAAAGAEAALDSLGGSGAGLAEDAAAADALAESLGHVRDEALEADAALAGSAAQYDKMADSVQAAKKRYDEFARSMTEGKDAAEKAASIAEDLKTSGLGDAQGSLAAGEAIGDYEQKLDSLKGTLADAEKYIDADGAAIEDSGHAADEAAGKLETYKNDVTGLKAAMENFSESAAQATSGKWEDLQNLGMATSELRGQFDKASASGEDFGAAFDDVDAAASDATAGIEDFAPLAADAGADAGEAGGGLSMLGGALGEVASSAGESVAGMAPMAGIIGALVVAAAGVAPPLAAAAAGMVSFGALGLPALEKVKTGLTDVTTAQQAYQQAVGVEKRDPTTSNLAAQQKALATLKTTWADLPQGVGASVSAIRQFGHAWSQVSQKSGIQQDVLGDIPKVIKDAEDALPALEGVAKTAAPIISSMFSDIGKNLQSGSFDQFTKSLEKDAPGAANAFHNIAGAMGGFISQLQEKGGTAGNQFLNSFANLVKTATPGAVTGLVNGVKALTGAMNGLNSAMKSPQAHDAATFISDASRALSEAAKVGSEADKVGGKVDSAVLGGYKKYLPSWMTGDQAVKVKVEPQVDKGALERSLQGSPIPLPVKPEIKLDKAALEASLQGAPLPLPVKPEKIDTSGLKGSDAKVPATAQVDKVDTSGINKAASNVKIHGVTVDLSDAKLSGLTALTSSLNSAGSSAGRSFDTGLASGINGGAGQPEAAAQHVVAEIKSALSSLGGAGSAAGAALGQGLAAGIAASTGAAVAAARTMANEVTAAVKAAHGTQSPSKVFKGIAADDVKGYILGLEGGKSQLATAAKDAAKGITAPFTDKTITDTITKLQTDLKDALKAGTISPTEETGISAWLDSDNKRLMSLAAQRKDIEAKIASADALYKSVDTATIAGANVVTFAGNVTSGASSSSSSDGSSSSSGSTTSQPTAAYTAQQNAQAVAMANQQTGDTMNIKAPLSLTANDSIQGQLKQYLNQTRSFRDDIVKLKKEGLDSTSLQQLLQAGVTSGLPAANMMLSGGPQGVKQIASLQDQIGKAAKQLGVTGANAAYESGSQIGGSLASGLKAELGSVTDAIKSLATSIVDEMSKGLSSGALENIGKDWASQIAKGMAGGGSGGGGGGAHAAPVLSAAGGGGGGTMHIHVNVGGTEIAQVVQTYTLQHARRNTGSGLQLSGRGT